MNRVDTPYQRHERGTAPQGDGAAHATGGAAPAGRHEIVRMRHEIRRRRLTVARIENLTPRMRRIHFTSPDLVDFNSPSPDDHIKLFFSQPEDPAERPVMRDYTPRAFDNAEKTLVIDFALHDAGPATEWAAQAAVGQTLDIGGPRGSQVVPDDFDWYLLIGDESALPAIGRRVEGLRPGVPVTTVVTVAQGSEAQVFTTHAAWKPIWVARGEPSERDGALLRQALSELSLPPGDGFVWIAGEASLARTVRAYILEERRHPKAWVKAAGYWQRGASDGHIDLGDP
ncbi:iron-chelator utilization protein [Minicystis rosea]|nr:iron-chelator utilization protein [Minicystis rosea]